MKQVFVFGSNLAGVHAAGSARHALDHHGAFTGIGEGLCGNSYAIPTKDEGIKTMPLSEIKPYVDKFLSFAKSNYHMTFNVVAIGCGLAGYKPEDITPMFRNAPKNCNLPPEFRDWLKLNPTGD